MQINIQVRFRYWKLPLQQAKLIMLSEKAVSCKSKSYVSTHECQSAQSTGESIDPVADGTFCAILCVAFVKENASMSSIVALVEDNMPLWVHYCIFENHVTYFVQKSKEVDPVNLYFCRTNKWLVAFKYIINNLISK